MNKKMGNKIYVAPRLEVLLYDVENVLGENSYPELGPGGGEDLGKENNIVFSDLPDDEFTWGNLWAENENEEE